MAARWSTVLTPLSLFYLSCGLGMVAHAMFVFGLVVLVIDRSQSVALASAAYFVTFAVMALLTPVRAVQADRERKAPLLVRCLTGMAVAVALLAVLALSPADGHLIGAGAIAAAALYGYATGGAAGIRLALLPQIVTKAAAPVMVVSIMAIAGFGLGPPLYAGLRTVGGDAAALAAAAAMLLASAIALPRVGEAAIHPPAPSQRVRDGLAEAARHVRAVPLLWQALILGSVPALLVLGPIQAVVPQLVAARFPADELFRGGFFSLMGGGLLLGGLIALAVVERVPWRKQLVAAAALLAGAALAALPLAASRPAMGALAVLCGLGLGIPNAVVPALLQAGSGDGFRSRVMNAFTLMVTLVPAVGAVLCGVLADLAGTAIALGAFGVAGLVAALGSLVMVGGDSGRGGARSLPPVSGS